jgi:alpha-N-arabinofuranosidase
MSPRRIGARGALQRRIAAVAALAAVAATIAGGAAAAGASAQNVGQPSPASTTQVPAPTTIEIEANQTDGTISPGVMGSGYLAPFGGMGSFDAATGRQYPSFLRQLRDDVYTGGLRFPGGITAEYYDWKRAIGPQSKRSDNPYGPTSTPSPSTVGPDEFGELLDQTGASGVFTTNFATGDAQEAAELVQYMTGRVGTSYWADLRARNGHPKPYDVPVWEVGNEEYTAGSSWRAGTPVSVGGADGACTVAVADCQYIYGGSDSFTNQAVVGYADRSSAASLSTGDGDQNFYIAYPPVASGSQTISIGDTVWTEVDSLADAGPEDDVYTIDDATGKITFGDGVHGAIPADGAKITASYVSGPHDGFIDFYKAMKKANPHIQVCSTDTDTAFIQAAGSTVPYDCLQDHPYVGGSNGSVDLSSYEQTLMAQPALEGAGLQSLEATIQADAGHSVPLDLTEYGSLISSSPDAGEAPYFLSSLDEALVNADQLAEWIKLGITVADRQLLTAEQPAPANVTSGLPGAAPFAVTGAIVTPGPDTVVEPTGQYLKLFEPLAGGTQIGSQVLNNPVITSSGGTNVGDLTVVAANHQDQTDVIVVNGSPTDDVTSSLNIAGISSDDDATVTTLNGASPLSYNTAADPDAVATRTSRTRLSNGTGVLTFPAHSITLLQVRDLGLPVAGPTVDVASPSSIVDPGGDTTVTATLKNPSRQIVSGTTSLILPAGWKGQVDAASRDSYSLHPGASTTVTYDITNPAGTSAGSYDVGVAAASHGLTVGVGTESLSVPFTLADTFNNVGITDDSNVTPGEYDGVGNSFSAEALAAGTPSLVPGGPFTSDGLAFTWPGVPAGTPDNTLTEGQTVAVSGSGTKLGFIGDSTSAILSGSGTVYYTDGTTSTYSLKLGRYFYATDASSAGDNVLLTMPYVNDSVSSTNGGSVQRKQAVTLFEQSVPITAGKTVEAVTLPNQATTSGGRITALHVFAIAVG